MLENGIEDAGSYPYIADEVSKQCLLLSSLITIFCYQETCQQNQQYKAAELVDYRMINGSEELMKHAVATLGPIAAYIQIRDAKDYAGQIRPVHFTEDCAATRFQDLDHAVMITGYGTTDDGQDYWIIKNSWGPGWGRDGYIWLPRGENHCGIGLEAFVPMVEKIVEKPKPKPKKKSYKAYGIEHPIPEKDNYQNSRPANGQNRPSDVLSIPVEGESLPNIDSEDNVDNGSPSQYGYGLNPRNNRNRAQHSDQMSTNRKPDNSAFGINFDQFLPDVQSSSKANKTKSSQISDFLLLLSELGDGNDFRPYRN